jgi:hypothetical protein
MSQQTEPVANFPTEAEARLALGRLEAEGIAGHVIPASDNLSRHAIVLPIHGGYDVVVAAGEAERARQVLLLHAHQPVPPGWEDEAERAIDGWICPGCDTPVSMNEAFCPECGASCPGVTVEDDEDDG